MTEKQYKEVCCVPEKDLISVVIPVYGVEDFLEQCMETILNQTYRNLEIILVDDGSPDRCGEICEYYKEKDNRVFVIHKNNGGLSDARNCGMESAKGKYITFVDSDDYLALDCLEHLHDLIVQHEAEISVIGHISTASRNCRERTSREIVEVYDHRQAIREMLYTEKFSTSAWGKLYLRKLFENIRYPVGRLSEDLFTTYKVLDRATKIVFGSQICYYYLRRPGSILISGFTERQYDAIEGLEQLKKDLPLKEYGLEEAYAACMTGCLVSLLEKEPDFKRFVSLGMWDRIKKYRRIVLKDTNAPKRVRGWAMLSYLGLHPLAGLLIGYGRVKWRKDDK